MEQTDYKALYEQVTRELEQARLVILKMRYSSQFSFNYAAFRSFIYDNYVVLVVGIMLLSFVSSAMKHWKIFGRR